MRMFLFGTLGLAVLGLGCDSTTGGLYGGGSTGGGDAGMMTGPDAGAVDDGSGTDVTAKVTVEFSSTSGFPQQVDPAEFTIGGVTLTASGGRAGTLGLVGLYSNDAFAWMLDAGSQGSIVFAGTGVQAVDGYWVHSDQQAGGATLTANFSGGGSASVSSSAVAAAGPLAQANGFFDEIVAPAGETITGLTFAFDAGAVDGDMAVLDSLRLTVATP